MLLPWGAFRPAGHSRVRRIDVAVKPDVNDAQGLCADLDAAKLSE